jgi:hypothetical protein
VRHVLSLVAGWLEARTTLRTLLWLRGALLAATALALAGCLSVFLGVHRNAQVVSAQTTPAILDVHETQVALLAAHGAAARSFERGEVILGAGEEYRNQIAVAEQSITRVAENNAAGDRGSQEIEVVEALLAGYTGLIEQANVYSRRSGGSTDSALVSAYMRDASSVLRDIQAHLDRLSADQTEALDRQVDAGWTASLTPVVWLLPVLSLLGLLAATQVFLSHRFRRTLNLPLAAATVLAALLGAATALSLLSTRELDESRDALGQVRAAQQAQARYLQEANAQALTDLLGKQCGTSQPCEDAVKRIVVTLGDGRPDGAAPAEPPVDQTAAEADRAVQAAERAADSHQIEYGLPIAALGIVALVLLGLQPRIEEYRYRRR